MPKHCKSSRRTSRWDRLVGLLGFRSKQCNCGGRKKRSYSFEPLEERQLLSVCHWMGGGADGNWSNSANWDRVPAASDDLVFQGANQLATNNDLAPDTSFHSIYFASNGFSVSGNNITMPDGGYIYVDDGKTATISANVATGVTAVYVGDNSRLIDLGLLSTSGSIAKAGTGTMVLTNANSVSPAVQVGSLIRGDASFAPYVSVAGAASVNEGSQYTLQLSSAATLQTSPDPWQIADWGDDVPGSADGSTATLTHTYANGTQNLHISASVTDSNGDVATITKAITVNNVAPQLQAFGDPEINVGDYTLNLSCYDPGADTIDNWVIDWRDGPAPSHEHKITYSGNPSSVTYTYTTPGIYNIVATAVESDGTYSVAANAGKLDATFGVGGMVLV
ncbi:MAG: PKD domain-containing protein, partial [Planctomycetaceae bacterium]|nr:PKD domain-containing protein [Planctomycetaceae bacterium]